MLKHPLLGARIECEEHMVVCERTLLEGRSEDVVLIDTDTLAWATDHLLRHDVQALDDEHTSRLFVRLTESGFELVLIYAHFVSDIGAVSIVARDLLRLLAGHEEALGDLADRLPLSCEALYLRDRRGSGARQRWRWAVARITLELRGRRMQVRTSPILQR